MKIEHCFTVAHRVYDEIRKFPVRAEVACVFHQHCHGITMTDAYYYPDLDMVSLNPIHNIRANVIPVKIQRHIYFHPDGTIHKVKPNKKSLNIGFIYRDFSKDNDYFEELMNECGGYPIFYATDEAVVYTKKDGTTGTLKTATRFADMDVSKIAFDPTAELHVEGKLVKPKYWWRDYITF